MNQHVNIDAMEVEKKTNFSTESTTSNTDLFVFLFCKVPIPAKSQQKGEEL